MLKDLITASIGELADAYRNRQASVREVVEAHLGRLGALNPKINAFSLPDPDGARAAAQALDRELAAGKIRSPLHGIPLTLKDLFATRSQRTAAGSAILRDHVTDHDAEVVRRLREAGAIFLGKTAMNEFAFSPTGLNPHYGPARNPWDLERITGGSSSGAAAATAAGVGSGALGTDTGGSVRLPAALCGVVGFKPSYDRLSRRGVLPLSWSLDHVGVLARSVAAAREVFDGAAVPEARLGPHREVSLRGLRLGVLEEYCRGLDSETGGRWEDLTRALTAAGARLVALEPKRLRLTIGSSTAVMFAEAAAVHWRWLRTQRARYGDEVRMRLLQGALIPARTYLRAQQLRRLIAEEIASLYAQAAWLICPTCTTVADRIADVDARTGGRLVRNTRLAPLLGAPAISIPLPVRGLPVGAQLIGPEGRDAELLDVAQAVETLVGCAPLAPL